MLELYVFWNAYLKGLGLSAWVLHTHRIEIFLETCWGNFDQHALNGLCNIILLSLKGEGYTMVMESFDFWFKGAELKQIPISSIGILLFFSFAFTNVTLHWKLYSQVCLPPATHLCFSSNFKRSEKGIWSWPISVFNGMKETICWSPDWKVLKRRKTFICKAKWDRLLQSSSFYPR